VIDMRRAGTSSSTAGGDGELPPLAQIVAAAGCAAANATSDTTQLCTDIVADSLAVAAAATSASVAGGGSVARLLTELVPETDRPYPLLASPVLGALAHWEEFDPFHHLSAGLPSMWVASVLDRAIASGRPWGAVTDAVAYAFEVAARLAEQIDGTGLYARGFLPASVMGTMASAAAIA